MQVFKFGGASVKDAENIKNAASILSQYKTSELLVVVSALNKTTNALQDVTDNYYRQDNDPFAVLDRIKTAHFHILHQRFSYPTHPIYNEVAN